MAPDGDSDSGGDDDAAASRAPSSVRSAPSPTTAPAAAADAAVDTQDPGFSHDDDDRLHAPPCGAAVSAAMPMPTGFPPHAATVSASASLTGDGHGHSENGGDDDDDDDDDDGSGATTPHRARRPTTATLRSLDLASAVAVGIAVSPPSPRRMDGHDRRHHDDDDANDDDGDANDDDGDDDDDHHRGYSYHGRRRGHDRRDHEHHPEAAHPHDGRTALSSPIPSSRVSADADGDGDGDGDDDALLRLHGPHAIPRRRSVAMRRPRSSSRRGSEHDSLHVPAGGPAYSLSGTSNTDFSTDHEADPSLPASLASDLVFQSDMWLVRGHRHLYYPHPPPRLDRHDAAGGALNSGHDVIFEEDAESPRDHHPHRLYDHDPLDGDDLPLDHRHGHATKGDAQSDLHGGHHADEGDHGHDHDSDDDGGGDQMDVVDVASFYRTQRTRHAPPSATTSAAAELGRARDMASDADMPPAAPLLMPEYSGRAEHISPADTDAPEAATGPAAPTASHRGSPPMPVHASADDASSRAGAAMSMSLSLGGAGPLAGSGALAARSAIVLVQDPGCWSDYLNWLVARYHQPMTLEALSSLSYQVLEVSAHHDNLTSDTALLGASGFGFGFGSGSGGLAARLPRSVPTLRDGSELSHHSDAASVVDFGSFHEAGDQTPFVLTPRTHVYSFSPRARVVMMVDVSDSHLSVDAGIGDKVEFALTLETLCKCLEGLILPFNVESKVLNHTFTFEMEILLTVVAYTPDPLGFVSGFRKHAVPKHDAPAPAAAEGGSPSLNADAAATAAAAAAAAAAASTETDGASLGLDVDSMAAYLPSTSPFKVVLHQVLVTKSNLAWIAEYIYDFLDVGRPAERDPAASMAAAAAMAAGREDPRLMDGLPASAAHLEAQVAASAPERTLQVLDVAMMALDLMPHEFAPAIGWITNGVNPILSERPRHGSPAPAPPPAAAKAALGSHLLNTRLVAHGVALTIVQVGASQGYTPAINYGHFVQHEALHFLAQLHGGRLMYESDCHNLSAADEVSDVVGTHVNFYQKMMLLREVMLDKTASPLIGSELPVRPVDMHNLQSFHPDYALPKVAPFAKGLALPAYPPYTDPYADPLARRRSGDGSVCSSTDATRRSDGGTTLAPTITDFSPFPWSQASHAPATYAILCRYQDYSWKTPLHHALANAVRRGFSLSHVTYDADRVVDVTFIKPWSVRAVIQYMLHLAAPAEAPPVGQSAAGAAAVAADGAAAAGNAAAEAERRYSMTSEGPLSYDELALAASVQQAAVAHVEINLLAEHTFALTFVNSQHLLDQPLGPRVPPQAYRAVMLHHELRQLYEDDILLANLLAMDDGLKQSVLAPTTHPSPVLLPTMVYTPLAGSDLEPSYQPMRADDAPSGVAPIPSKPRLVPSLTRHADFCHLLLDLLQNQEETFFDQFYLDIALQSTAKYVALPPNKPSGTRSATATATALTGALPSDTTQPSPVLTAASPCGPVSTTRKGRRTLRRSVATIYLTQLLSDVLGFHCIRKHVYVKCRSMPHSPSSVAAATSSTTTAATAAATEAVSPPPATRTSIVCIQLQWSSNCLVRLALSFFNMARHEQLDFHEMLYKTVRNVQHTVHAPSALLLHPAAPAVPMAGGAARPHAPASTAKQRDALERLSRAAREASLHGGGGPVLPTPTPSTPMAPGRSSIDVVPILIPFIKPVSCMKPFDPYSQLFTYVGNTIRIDPRYVGGAMDALAERLLDSLETIRTLQGFVAISELPHEVWCYKESFQTHAASRETELAFGALSQITANVAEHTLALDLRIEPTLLHQNWDAISPYSDLNAAFRLVSDHLSEQLLSLDALVLIHLLTATYVVNLVRRAGSGILPASVAANPFGFATVHDAPMVASLHPLPREARHEHVFEASRHQQWRCTPTLSTLLAQADLRVTAYPICPVSHGAATAAQTTQHFRAALTKGMSRDPELRYLGLASQLLAMSQYTPESCRQGVFYLSQLLVECMLLVSPGGLSQGPLCDAEIYAHVFDEGDQTYVHLYLALVLPSTLAPITTLPSTTTSTPTPTTVASTGRRKSRSINAPPAGAALDADVKSSSASVLSFPTSPSSSMSEALDPSTTDFAYFPMITIQSGPLDLLAIYTQEDGIPLLPTSALPVPAVAVMPTLPLSVSVPAALADWTADPVLTKIVPSPPPPPVAAVAAETPRGTGHDHTAERHRIWALNALARASYTLALEGHVLPVPEWRRLQPLLTSATAIVAHPWLQVQHQFATVAALQGFLAPTRAPLFNALANFLRLACRDEDATFWTWRNPTVPASPSGASPIDAEGPLDLAKLCLPTEALDHVCFVQPLVQVQDTTGAVLAEYAFPSKQDPASAHVAQTLNHVPATRDAAKLVFGIRYWHQPPVHSRAGERMPTMCTHLLEVMTLVLLAETLKWLAASASASVSVDGPDVHAIRTLLADWAQRHPTHLVGAAELDRILHGALPSEPERRTDGADRAVVPSVFAGSAWAGTHAAFNLRTPLTFVHKKAGIRIFEAMLQELDESPIYRVYLADAGLAWHQQGPIFWITETRDPPASRHPFWILLRVQKSQLEIAGSLFDHHGVSWQHMFCHVMAHIMVLITRVLTHTNTLILLNDLFESRKASHLLIPVASPSGPRAHGDRDSPRLTATGTGCLSSASLDVATPTSATGSTISYPASSSSSLVAAICATPTTPTGAGPPSSLQVASEPPAAPSAATAATRRDPAEPSVLPLSASTEPGGVKPYLTSGRFAPPLVLTRQLWVHPRVRPSHALTYLLDALHPFVVVNRPRTLVFADDDAKFYMVLETAAESRFDLGSASVPAARLGPETAALGRKLPGRPAASERAMSRAGLDDDAASDGGRTSIAGDGAMTGSFYRGLDSGLWISIHVFGLQPPGPSLTDKFLHLIQTKLSALTQQVLSTFISRNTDIRFTRDDLDFLFLQSQQTAQVRARMTAPPLMATAVFLQYVQALLFPAMRPIRSPSLAGFMAAHDARRTPLGESDLSLDVGEYVAFYYQRASNVRSGDDKANWGSGLMAMSVVLSPLSETATPSTVQAPSDTTGDTAAARRMNDTGPATAQTASTVHTVPTATTALSQVPTIVFDECEDDIPAAAVPDATSDGRQLTISLSAHGQIDLAASVAYIKQAVADAFLDSLLHQTYVALFQAMDGLHGRDPLVLDMPAVQALAMVHALHQNPLAAANDRFVAVSLQATIAPGNMLRFARRLQKWLQRACLAWPTPWQIGVPPRASPIPVAPPRQATTSGESTPLRSPSIKPEPPTSVYLLSVDAWPMSPAAAATSATSTTAAAATAAAGGGAAGAATSATADRPPAVASGMTAAGGLDAVGAMVIHIQQDGIHVCAYNRSSALVRALSLPIQELLCLNLLEREAIRMKMLHAQTGGGRSTLAKPSAVAAIETAVGTKTEWHLELPMQMVQTPSRIPSSDDFSSLGLTDVEHGAPGVKYETSPRSTLTTTAPRSVNIEVLQLEAQAATHYPANHKGTPLHRSAVKFFISDAHHWYGATLSDGALMARSAAVASPTSIATASATATSGPDAGRTPRSTSGMSVPTSSVLAAPPPLTSGSLAASMTLASGAAGTLATATAEERWTPAAGAAWAESLVGDVEHLHSSRQVQLDRIVLIGLVDNDSSISKYVAPAFNKTGDPSGEGLIIVQDRLSEGTSAGATAAATATAGGGTQKPAQAGVQDPSGTGHARADDHARCIAAKSMIQRLADRAAQYFETTGFRLLSTLSMPRNVYGNGVLQQWICDACWDLSTSYYIKKVDAGRLYIQLGVQSFYLQYSLFCIPARVAMPAPSETLLESADHVNSLIHFKACMFDATLAIFQSNLEGRHPEMHPIDTLQALRLFARIYPVRPREACCRFAEGQCLRIQSSHLSVSLFQYILKNPQLYGFGPVACGDKTLGCYIQSCTPDFKARRFSTRHACSAQSAGPSRSNSASAEAAARATAHPTASAKTEDHPYSYTVMVYGVSQLQTDVFRFHDSSGGAAVLTPTGAGSRGTPASAHHTSERRTRGMGAGPAPLGLAGIPVAGAAAVPGGAMAGGVATGGVVTGPDGQPQWQLIVRYFIIVRDLNVGFPQPTRGLSPNLMDDNPLREYIGEGYYLSDIVNSAENVVHKMVEEAQRYFSRDNLWRSISSFPGALRTLSDKGKPKERLMDWSKMFLEKIAPHARPLRVVDASVAGFFARYDLPWTSILDFFRRYYAETARELSVIGNTRHLIIFNQWNRDYLIHFSHDLSIAPAATTSSVYGRMGLLASTVVSPRLAAPVAAAGGILDPATAVLRPLPSDPNRAATPPTPMITTPGDPTYPPDLGGSFGDSARASGDEGTPAGHVAINPHLQAAASDDTHAHWASLLDDPVIVSSPSLGVLASHEPLYPHGHVTPHKAKASAAAATAARTTRQHSTLHETAPASGVASSSPSLAAAFPSREAAPPPPLLPGASLPSRTLGVGGVDEDAGPPAIEVALVNREGFSDPVEYRQLEDIVQTLCFWTWMHCRELQTSAR
ncbi:hypothetical protein CXG81DRAFT_18257 [Caulochytrium protostelioides]|uniref:Uncharacterized protein n=1 Tax=Caulochytrium protostelioides TaxID=1555241 RepID=A0A4P9X9P3_9FUNG|nr:hypothetical protein CXG81DRAFT_18257 [Caulochytrium protostelioides]|eukprot:RKP02022.1 hypothetical protein CXG81DRAFT_18257 [Caulochytrium protostelioides]